MSMKPLLIVASLVALLWIVFGGIPADQRELENAESRWSNGGSDAYVYTYTRSCECDDLTRGPIRVVVSDGAVQSVAYVGEAPVGGAAEGISGYTVQQLFGIIDQYAQRGIDNDVRYSPLGYPERMFLDLDEMALDGGFGLTIHEFEVQ